jgi:hypothetical protein
MTPAPSGVERVSRETACSIGRPIGESEGERFDFSDGAYPSEEWNRAIAAAQGRIRETASTTALTIETLAQPYLIKHLGALFPPARKLARG